MKRSVKVMKLAKGFTIVELLIVIVVIAILAAISIVAYNGITDRANNAAVQSDLRSAAQKIQAYQITEGEYPTSTNQLDGLVKVTASAYSDKNNRFMYCWRGSGTPRFAIAGRSKSGQGFYYSSRDGAKELASWSFSITDMCNATGITQPGFPNGDLWFRDWGYTNNWSWWVETE